MKTETIKQQLIDKIQLINDDVFLEQISAYISLSVSSEKVYELSSDEIEAISVSDVEFDKKQYSSNDEVKKKIDSWLLK